MTGARLRIFFCGFGLLLCAAPAFSQDTNWAERMFERTSHDFGIVARGADTRQRITIRNIYQPTVHIASVRTSCGCTAAQPNKDTLLSNESAYIEVTMNTHKFTHQKNSSITVVFDAPSHAEVHIPISAYIRTDVVLTPGSVQFGSMTKGQEQPRKIAIAYAGRNDWAIQDLGDRNPRFNIQVMEKSRSPGRVDYELTVAVKPGVSTGDLREQLTLPTNDPHRPQIPILIEGQIESEYTISPEVVSFGTLRPGEKKTVNVVVRGKKLFQIDKVVTDKSPEAFQVKLPQTEKVVHVLPVTITAPEAAGTLNEQFTVTIAGNQDPYRFKVYGKIAGTATVQTSANSVAPAPQGDTIGALTPGKSAANRAD